MKKLGFSDSSGIYRYGLDITIPPNMPTGRFHERIIATSNTKDTLMATLRISGRIVSDVDVMPKILNFIVQDSAKFQFSKNKQLAIRNYNRNKVLKILDYRDEDNNLILKLIPKPEGEKYLLSATLKEFPSKKLTEGKIIIKTNYSDHRLLTVPYKIRLKGSEKRDKVIQHK